MRSSSGCCVLGRSGLPTSAGASLRSVAPDLLDIPDQDKIGHAVAYFAVMLPLLFALVWRPGRGEGVLPNGQLWLVAGLISVGIVMEVLQALFTSTRSPDVLDAVADAVGTCGAMLLFRAVRLARKHGGVCLTARCREWGSGAGNGGRMIRHIRAVTTDQWRSLLRAAWWLAVVRFSLAVVGFRRTRAWTEHAAPRPGLAAEPEDVGWSVEAVGRRIPGTRCLPRALAAEVILRRAGRDPRLCFGAVRDDRGGIEAHAWVEDAGRIVVGGRDRDRFTLLQA